jgi:2-dehydropantoate 2-reductase
MQDPKIVIAGAGSIGCFVGGHLALAGRDVTLLARPRVIAEIEENGLTISDLSGGSDHVPADNLKLTDNPDCLAAADLVLVTVKTGATAEVAELIKAQTPAEPVVVSLQNGLSGITTLSSALPNRDVRAGMVGFNVVPDGKGGYHRATSGDVFIGNGPVDLDDVLSTSGLPIIQTPEITAIQWGKLLLNLNNAPNALSGLPLYQMMMDRDWRRLMADQMAEALRAFKAANILVKSTTPLPASFLPHILRLPTPLFSRIAAKMLKFDPTARSSMSYDLMAGRRTEIEAFQGAVIELADRHDVATPICATMRDLVRKAEKAGEGAPNLTLRDIRSFTA